MATSGASRTVVTALRCQTELTQSAHTYDELELDSEELVEADSSLEVTELSAVDVTDSLVSMGGVDVTVSLVSMGGVDIDCLGWLLDFDGARRHLQPAATCIVVKPLTKDCLRPLMTNQLTDPASADIDCDIHGTVEAAERVRMLEFAHQDFFVFQVTSNGNALGPRYDLSRFGHG